MHRVDEVATAGVLRVWGGACTVSMKLPQQASCPGDTSPPPTYTTALPRQPPTRHLLAHTHSISQQWRNRSSSNRSSAVALEAVAGGAVALGAVRMRNTFQVRRRGTVI